MTRSKKKKRAAEARGQVADVAAQIAELEHLTTTQLATRYAEIFGEPTRSRNKPYLKKKVAYRIQELAEGGLSGRAKARIEELAEDAPIRHRQRRDRSTATNTTPNASPKKQRDPRLATAQK